MKVYTKEGIVVAEAETFKDIELLLALKKEEPAKATTPKRTYQKRTTYKKQYVKECDVCGKQVKGNCGLAVHKRHNHPAAKQIPVTEMISVG